MGRTLQETVYVISDSTCKWFFHALEIEDVNYQVDRHAPIMLTSDIERARKYTSSSDASLDLKFISGGKVFFGENDTPAESPVTLSVCMVVTTRNLTIVS